MGVDDDYPDRLLRSSSGRAFKKWLQAQPDEFVARHTPPFGSEDEQNEGDLYLEDEEEETSSRDETPDALTEFLRGDKESE